MNIPNHGIQTNNDNNDLSVSQTHALVFEQKFLKILVQLVSQTQILVFEQYLPVNVNYFSLSLFWGK